jgi:tetratricopeptide (TPR) repeat protein
VAFVGHIYVGLAAEWRGDGERAEAELRKAVELEPLSAYAGQSVALLARHLASQGRAEEVMELFRSPHARSRWPGLDRVNSLGSWNCLFGFVEAFFLCDLHDQAAALFPLMTQALELGTRWTTFDGGLMETHAGLVAAAAHRWEEAERQFDVAREVAGQMRNLLELADLSRLHARMLLDRGGADDHARAAEMLGEALSAYRAFGMSAYAAEVERLMHQAPG